jgi:hypothetical protein
MSPYKTTSWRVYPEVIDFVGVPDYTWIAVVIKGDTGVV